MYGDGHSNKPCFKVWGPQSSTNFHVWQNSGGNKRGSCHLLFPLGGRAWRLPWTHPWTLPHAPRTTDQDDLQSNCVLERKTRNSQSLEDAQAGASFGTKKFVSRKLWWPYMHMNHIRHIRIMVCVFCKERRHLSDIHTYIDLRKAHRLTYSKIYHFAQDPSILL